LKEEEGSSTLTASEVEGDGWLMEAGPGDNVLHT